MIEWLPTITGGVNQNTVHKKNDKYSIILKAEDHEKQVTKNLSENGGALLTVGI